LLSRLFIGGDPKRRAVEARSDPWTFPIGAAGGSIVKMKIFTGHGDAVVLEGELNEWLEKNAYITIRNVKQSYVSSGEQLFTLMSVWYDN
jgi:hypothetical protein